MTSWLNNNKCFQVPGHTAQVSQKSSASPLYFWCSVGQMPGYLGRTCQQECTCMTSEPSTPSALPALGCLLNSSERAFDAFCTPLNHLVPVALENLLQTWWNNCHSQSFTAYWEQSAELDPRAWPSASVCCVSTLDQGEMTNGMWRGAQLLLVFSVEKERPLNQKDFCLLLICKIRPGREYPVWWNLTKSIHWLRHICGQVLSTCLWVTFPYHLCYSIPIATAWLDSFNRLVYPYSYSRNIYHE